jgi:hypothetical protein
MVRMGGACDQTSVGTSHAPGQYCPGNHLRVSLSLVEQRYSNAHARRGRHIEGETVPVLDIVESNPALQAISKTDDQEGDRVQLRRSNDDDEDG